MNDDLNLKNSDVYSQNNIDSPDTKISKFLNISLKILNEIKIIRRIAQNKRENYKLKSKIMK